jgi:hypothetical protein
MARFMKENSKMINVLVQELFTIQMVRSTLVSGRKAKNTAKGIMNGQMEQSTIYSTTKAIKG